MELLSLDANIFFRVFCPMLLVVILCSLLRQRLQQGNKPPQSAVGKDEKQLMSGSVLHRSRVFRAVGPHVLPLRAFLSRKVYFVGGDGSEGELSRAPETNPMQALEMFTKQDPTVAMGVMKTQLVFVAMQGFMAYLSNTLFSGCILAKIPIALPYQFKWMLQRGIDVLLLDATYVSSLSWYFLVMLSSSGLLVLISSIFFSAEAEADPMDPLQQMNPMMMGGPMMLPGMGGGDDKKSFNQEKDAIQLLEPSFFVCESHTILVKMWQLE